MNTELLKLGSEALKTAALNQEAKSYLLNNEMLYALLKKAADRYIGGETLTETIPKAIRANSEGYKTSIEFMGENTRTVKEADLATQEFLNIIEQISELQLNSTVSLDLSHIGLSISKELALANLIRLCEKARSNDIEIIISAEGPEATDHVLLTYLEGIKKYDKLGITMQAYLFRSADDFKDLIKEKGRIRVVKGAFAADAKIAMPRGEKLDQVYLDFVSQLLSQNHLCSIASHHDLIQHESSALIDHYQADKSIYEFESLFGIQNEPLAKLKENGHPSKLYFVYGEEWYLYLCNRLAEYPMNLFRALSDMIGM